MALFEYFTDQDWERIEQAWGAWWAHDLDRPLILIDGLESAVTGVEHDFASSFPLEMPAAEVIDYYEARLEQARVYGDNFPKWWVNFGPGIMAGFVGGGVHTVRDTVWFSPPPQHEYADLHPAYAADNPWWARVLDLTRLAVERWGSRAAVGLTDLGGNLDIAASLRTTEQLLLDLYDAPDEVERLTREITPLWLRYYDELAALIRRQGRGTTPWASIWSPGTCYMLQSDFSYMIAPAMFERYVLPDLAACCDHLDHAFYHLDGKGQIAHLDMLLGLERLRGIQWVPGDGAPPPEDWLPLLRRIRETGKLCQLYVTPRGALKIVRELGGRGFALHINERLSPPDADDLLRLLAREDRRERAVY